MLNDPNEEPYWPNIVVLLGMIGDENALAPMIDFIEARSDGKLSRSHYVAKTSAVMSLGYLVNLAGSEAALDYLKRAAQTSTWADSEVGVAPFQERTSERNVDFAKHAWLGLALAGTDEAANSLRQLQAEPLGREAITPAETQLSDLISEALKENRMIAEEGLDSYYKDR
jgi:hypothetical protein